jgi:hypothetical protein
MTRTPATSRRVGGSNRVRLITPDVSRGNDEPGVAHKLFTNQPPTTGLPSAGTVDMVETGIQPMPILGDVLLSAKDIAKELGIPVKSVYTLGIPGAVEISPRRYRWWRSKLLIFLHERTKLP